MVEPFGRTIDRGINGKLPTRARAGHDGFHISSLPLSIFSFSLFGMTLGPQTSNATVVQISAMDIP